MQDKKEKDIRLSVRLSEELKDEFFTTCEKRGQTPSKVIKSYIRRYIDMEQ